VSVAGFSVESYSTADSWSETYYHLAVRDDGSIWEFSINPVAVGPVRMAGISDVRMVAASVNQNLALKRDGTVWEWGVRGPKEPRATPTQVSGLTDVVAVAADNQSLALKRDGTVRAWGDNFWGQLGDGTRTDRATPVQVSALNDVAAIATNVGDMFIGIAHSVALKRDGTVWEWPIYVWERPMYPFFVPKSLTPVQVAGLTDVVAAAAGGGHSLALKSDGTVWAWGQNISGQLGVRTFAIRTTPVQVVAPATQ
jgi:alpha-tubulin suppressor-like RCC1 family protein